MTVDDEAEHAIGTALSRYCRTFDEAQFEEFAALFERGRWFMVAEPGSRPVHEWIDQHIVLYDGRPLTRHVVSGLVVDVDGAPREATFRCNITIAQQLPGEDERILAHARFTGTFRKEDDRWWWRDHTMHAEQAGDLSTHIRGGVPS